MPEPDAKRLVALLQARYLRNRTGIMLLSQAWLGRESDLAARLGITYRDHRQLLLDSLAPGQRFLGIGWEDLVSTHLDSVARDAAVDGGCILVANIDVTLASLHVAERASFWSHLRELYKPACSLLLTLPNHYQRLIPEEEYQLWSSGERLASWD